MRFLDVLKVLRSVYTEWKVLYADLLLGDFAF